MHLQQSKLESRATGGPQYWIQSAPGYITEYLRRRRACPVVLQTPYGITWSQFVAVHRDWKPVGRKIVSANAQHDRIQQGSATRSIGEEIRYWYGVKEGQDFERIDVDVQIYDKIQQEEHFILIPTKVKMRGRARPRDLERVIAPLSFHHKYQSPFWRGHLD